VTRDREYLVSRYGPEDFATLSEINRLVATLDEVASKVAEVVCPANGVPTPPLFPRQLCRHGRPGQN
jgi:hypothetical protein